MRSIPFVPVSTPAARPWLSRTLRRDLQQAAVATAGTGVVALQSLPDASASYPLVAFLKAAGIPWVVEGTGGQLHDALVATGAPKVNPAVVIYGSVLHAASAELMLGTFTSGMLASAGCTPEYMGPVEPLQEPWDPAVLTTRLRENMPWGIELVSGQGFAGAVTAYRTEAGVVEAFDVLISAPDVDALPDPAALEAAAVGANAQEIGLELHFGASGLSVPAGREALRVPQLLMLGPSLHRSIPETLIKQPEGMAMEILGQAPFQHLAVRYPVVSAWDGGVARVTQQRILSAAQGK
ncbi:DUF6177 family protein [Arthrobacter sp. D3-18]